jgi:predicted dehydrogenase
MAHSTSSGTGAFAVGIVGAGQITADVHLPVLLNTPEFQVAWVSDRDDARARLVASSFALDHVKLPSSAAHLPHADVVLLAVPYGARPDYYRALGGAGVAVYVEKPFARSLLEHEGHSASFAPERLAVGFQMRSAGAVATLRELVRSRLFGALEKVEIRFGWPGVATGGRYSSSLTTAGGGLLFEVGCHYLDLALFVADAVDVEVTSGKMIRDAGFDLHTEAQGNILTAEKGRVLLALLVTNLRHTSMNVTFEFAHASVVLNMWGDRTLHVRPRVSSLELTVTAPTLAQTRTPFQLVHAQWVAFAEAIRSGEPNYSNACLTRATTALVEQLYGLPEGG